MNRALLAAVPLSALAIVLQRSAYLAAPPPRPVHRKLEFTVLLATCPGKLGYFLWATGSLGF